MQKSENCFSHFFARPYEPTELTALLQNHSAENNSTKWLKFKKFSRACIGNIAATANTGGSLDYSWYFYARVFTDCMKGPCVQEISMQSNYIAVGLAWLDFLLRRITKSRAPATYKKIIPYHDNALNMIGFHVFLLLGIFSAYVEVAKRQDPSLTDVNLDLFPYGAMIIGGAAGLSILGNRALKASLWKRCGNRCGFEERDPLFKLVDSFFGALNGFSGGWGFLYSIEGFTESIVSEFISDFTVIDTTPGRWIRYGVGGLLGIAMAAYELNYPYLDRERRSKYEWLRDRTMKVCYTLFFTYYLYKFFSFEADIHSWIQGGLYLTLLLSSFVFSGYNVFCNDKDSLQDQSATENTVTVEEINEKASLIQTDSNSVVSINAAVVDLTEENDEAEQGTSSLATPNMM